METIIFIFTNYDKWSSLVGRDETVIEGLNLLATNHVLQYNNNNLIPIENINNLQNGEIIFAWDGGQTKGDCGLKKCQDIKAVLGTQTAIYTVRHEHGIEFECGSNEMIKPDSHVTNSSYAKIKTILSDSNITNKTEKIIKEIFTSYSKLEAALKLLHSLLCGKENADNSAIKELEKENKIDISEMLKLLKGKPFTEEYNQSLANFRDELLAKVFTE